MHNNPLIYVDPSGHIPSPLEAAYMAEAIYNVEEDINGAALEGGWILKDIFNGNEGLKIGVYTRIAWGVREYVLVNKGTTTLGDWGNNIQQPFGASTDMQESIEFAVGFVDTHAGIEVTMVGHSKGGAEAFANAIATNTNAITFNSAKASVLEYDLLSELVFYSANMRHYVVTGDLLTDTFGAPTLGEVIYLETQHPIVAKDGPKEWFNNAKANHSIESVINALRKGRK